MNIFFLDFNAKMCAQYHNDKHVVKMILETCQLLSTAHRVIDGVLLTGISDSGRKTTSWILPDGRNDVLYKATHLNHPSAIWVRQSKENYLWLHSLLCELSQEYTYRYGKVHKCEQIGLIDALGKFPNNLKTRGFTEPTPAMDKSYIIENDSIASYRNYYQNAKQHLASWSGKINSRNIPEWFGVSNANLSNA
jgi:hypothetical protein